VNLTVGPVTILAEQGGRQGRPQVTHTLNSQSVCGTETELGHWALTRSNIHLGSRPKPMQRLN